MGSCVCTRANVSAEVDAAMSETAVTFLRHLCQQAIDADEMLVGHERQGSHTSGGARLAKEVLRHLREDESAHARGFAAGEAAMQERAAKEAEVHLSHMNACYESEREVGHNGDPWDRCADVCEEIIKAIRALPKTVGE